MSGRTFAYARVLTTDRYGRRLFPDEKLILLLLADYADERHLAWVTAETLTSDSLLTQDRVEAILGRLIVGGIIRALDGPDGNPMFVFSRLLVAMNPYTIVGDISEPHTTGSRLRLIRQREGDAP